jgi:hypothetical protein
MRLRPFAIALVLFAPVTTPIACTVLNADLAEGGPSTYTSGSGGNLFPTSSGAGGDDAGGDKLPDGAPTNQADEYANLCGKGACVVGASPDGCAIPPNLTTGTGPDGAPGEACELVPSSSGPAHAACAAVGPSGDGGPCMQAADCGAGLGCVETANGGVCRPYCCGNVEACPDKSYCAPRPMAEDDTTKIPVCVPTDGCTLLPSADSCPQTGNEPGPGCCPAGLACFIVRADGTTTCLPEGKGALGEPCPCEAGYVCSKLTNQCKKLCHLNNDSVDCPGGGKCQGGSMAYPPGFGVCVAGSQKSY